MREALTACALSLGLCVAIAAVATFERFKWHECRKVGHGVAYCLLVTHG